MRGLRSFLALLVVLIGLGAYLYFVESKREPGSDSQKDRIFAVESDAIEEITVRAESGERTTLRKSGSEWQIVEPSGLQPDNAEVSGLTSNLASLESQRLIDENPSDLDQYGLASPRVEIAFKSKAQEHRLLIGRKTPTGTDLYAKRADQPKVFLISSYLDSTFNRKPFDLRDKTVLKLDRSTIDALFITTPSRTVAFTKAKEGDWRMSQPVDARADVVSVDALVSRLTTLQMKSIAAEDAKSLSEYGLDTPAATVQLGSGSSRAVLLLGKSAEQGSVYAKDQSRPAVLTVDAGLLDDLKKDAAQYRSKDLFDARAFNATRIEVMRDGQTFAFEKTKAKNKEGQDEEKWRQVSPSPQDVEQSKVENLLSSVTQARATGFADSTAGTGLDAPALRVTIQSDEGRRDETVAFNRTGNDAYAARSGEPGAAKVDTSTIDNITKALDELVSKAPAK